jgi:hypothetical protein
MEILGLDEGEAKNAIPPVILEKLEQYESWDAMVYGLFCLQAETGSDDGEKQGQDRKKETKDSARKEVLHECLTVLWSILDGNRPWNRYRHSYGSDAFYVRPGQLCGGFTSWEWSGRYIGGLLKELGIEQAVPFRDHEGCRYVVNYETLVKASEMIGFDWENFRNRGEAGK